MAAIPAEATKNLRDEIFKETEQKFHKAGFTAKNIAREYALVAFSDISDYIQVDEQGSVKPISFDSLHPNKTKAIKKIREKRRILNGKENDTILEDTFEFELHDKLEALKEGTNLAGLKPTDKHEYDLTGSLMAAVAAHLSGEKNDGPGK